MLCARLQAVLRGGNPGARYPMTSVGVCGALPRLRGRWHPPLGRFAIPQRLRDRARHVQGPNATVCFAHHRPRKRGNAPRVATSIDLASEVQSANPELQERNENFPIVPLGT